MLAASHAIVPSWLSVVLALFGLAGLLGSAWAMFKGGWSSSTITLLRENNDALKDRLAEVEKSDAANKAMIAAQAQRIQMLETTVSGTKAVEDLGKVIAELHRETMQAIHSMDVVAQLTKQPSTD